MMGGRLQHIVSPPWAEGENPTQSSCAFTFPDDDYGTVQKQYMYVKVATTSGSYNITVSGGWTPSSIPGDTAAKTVRLQKTGGAWDDGVTLTTGPNDKLIVYEGWKKVVYDSASSKTGAAFRGGSGLVGTHLVDRFHAVIKGMHDEVNVITDPMYGQYGGYDSLIERPDRIIKHWLIEKMGFSLGHIDQDLFDAAGTSYDAAGYKLGFRIDRAVDPLEVLKRLAFESRSRLFYHRGRWRVVYLPDTAPGPMRTISSGELAGEGAHFLFRRGEEDAVVNDLTARFIRGYSRLEGDSPWGGTATASDAASQARHGVRPGVIDLSFIRQQAVADNLLGHILLQRAEPRLSVTFPVFWEHFDLAPGDTVQIDNSFYNGKLFFIEGIRRLDPFTAEIRAVEWW